ncbi:MAG TPA: hypothetical protein VGP46_14300, partial [Acidimicrobiales bacterium]|nr:hypothetical protein [Acidimicrobiales bacterium]
MRDSGSRRFTGKYLPVLLGAAVALGACSKAASPPPTSTPTTLKPTTTGSGCDKPASPGTVIDSFRIGGRARTVIVHVPTGYSGTTSVALVLNLHGSGSDAAEQEGLTAMDATSDSDGFIVAYPQGDIKDGTGFDWNVPGVPLFG